jgi:hypothetical protein
MRALRITSIIVGVLLVLVIVADRVALWIAQNEVASRAQTELGLASEPGVSIKGFPFLTQVLGGRLDNVDLSTDAYTAEVDGQSLTVRDLDVRLDDVELTDSFTGAVAAGAEGDGLIDYEELSRAYGELLAVQGQGFGVEFGYGGEGQLLMTLQASVMGQSLDVGEVTGDIVLADDTLTLDVPEEEIPDAGGEEMQAAIREQLHTERTLGGLPVGLGLETVEPTEEGLALTVTGSDVQIG